jgi:hypothetical protein
MGRSIGSGRRVARRPAHGHDPFRCVLGPSVDGDLISAIKKYVGLGLVAAVLAALVYDYKVVPGAYPQEIVSGPKISGANPETPLQDDLSARRSFRDGDFTIDVLAGYDIYGTVVHHESYHYDRLSSISSLDLGIAFGDFVRHPDLVNRFKFSQFDRFIYIKPKGGMPVDDWTRYTWQVSNNHLIFSNSQLAETVHAVAVGDRVRLKGYLIRASTANFAATSSLTRYDTGPGACEIVFVTDARVFR